jgi:hypothetical protein
MSDLSVPLCALCERLQYECVFSAGKCCGCGEELEEEAIEAGREQCFECYCEAQD